MKRRTFVLFFFSVLCGWKLNAVIFTVFLWVEPNAVMFTVFLWVEAKFCYVYSVSVGGSQML